jgi:Chromo (CHRromatin Organisation MOdifier) domain
MVNRRSDRTLRSVSRPPSPNQTKKKKRKPAKRKPPEEQDPIQPFEIAYHGVSLDAILNGTVSEVSQDFLENVFEIISNNVPVEGSLFASLSQYLYGTDSRGVLLQETVCKRPTQKGNCPDPNILFRAIQAKYKVNILVFEASQNQRYRILRYGEFDKKHKLEPLYILFDERSKRYSLMQVRAGKRRQREPAQDDDQEASDPSIVEYIVGAVLDYRYPNRKYTSLEDVEFLVHWKGYSSNADSYVPWVEVKDVEKFQEYLDTFKDKRVKPKFVKDVEVLDKREAAEAEGNPVQGLAQSPSARPLRRPIPPRKRITLRKKKKNLTGRKFTIIGDVLDLKDKGGIYAYYPYERLDDKNKGMFKVGMSTNFEKRFESVHSYYPEGIYLVAFYSNPLVPEMTPEEVRQWKRANKSDKPPTKATLETMYYLRMERFIFKYLEEHRAKRFYSTTRVKFPNEDKKGATEYFYTSEDLIHEAFEAAQEKFPGGRLQQFYLQGIDPDTGEEVESINHIAKEREEATPNFTGKLIYRL